MKIDKVLAIEKEDFIKNINNCNWDKVSEYILLHSDRRLDFSYTSKYYYECDEDNKCYLLIVDYENSNTSIVTQYRLYECDYMGEAKKLLYKHSFGKKTWL